MAQYNSRLYVKVQNTDVLNNLNQINAKKFGLSVDFSDLINNDELIIDDWSIKEFDLLELVNKIVSCTNKQAIVIADSTNLGVDSNDFLIYNFGKNTKTHFFTVQNNGEIANLFHKTKINEIENLLKFANIKIDFTEGEFLKEFGITYKDVKKYKVIDDPSKFLIEDTVFKKLKRLGSADMIVIPEGVTVIETVNCKDLQTAILPSTLQVIKDEAFKNRKSLNDIVLPNGLTKIGTACFNNCESLNSIVIPDTVTSIGSRAFSQSGLTSIYIPNSVKTIGAGAFLCPKLERISLPVKFKEKFEKIVNSSCLLEENIEFRD